MKKQIHLNETQFNQIIKESVKRILKEADSYGWVVETEDAELAYNFMAQEIGNEALNEAIVRAMGYETLAQIMAYLLRMYDMKGWEEYRDEHNNR